MKVLRFYAYFQEAIEEKREEKYRIRDCVILFYLEDDSVQVNESVMENSGMPQGQKDGISCSGHELQFGYSTMSYMYMCILELHVTTNSQSPDVHFLCHCLAKAPFNAVELFHA